MKVTVFGAGYVGLVTAACLAKMNHSVVCVDTNHAKVALINQGQSPIYEQGLNELLKEQLASGRFHCSEDITQAVNHGDLLMVAVGTPLTEEQDIDLSYVEQVIDSIGQHLTQPTTVVIKSTVPPGTAEHLTHRLNHVLAQRALDFTVDVVNNPEFLQEGNAIKQFMFPDRIIIGAEKECSINQLKELYHFLLKENVPLQVMDKASAELTKYAANALLATKISFINEISQIAKQVGANIEAVATGIGQDYRINPRFLKAGCGFGGSCFPKDIMTLIATAKRMKLEPHMLNAVIERNRQQQRWLFEEVQDFFKHQLQDKVIALWGLTFKPHTDDVRYASSHVIAQGLWQAGSHINVYDPLGMDNFARSHRGQKALTCCQSALAAVENADALIISTEWPEFKDIALSTIKEKLNNAAIFDGRNLLDLAKVREQQFYYVDAGRVKAQ